MPQVEQAPRRTPHQHAQRLHLQALRRCLVPSVSPRVSPTRRSSLSDRVVGWLFPWTVETYPGVHRGFLAVLGNRVSWDVVRHWLHDRRPVPAWAAEVLADYIEARCRAGLELVAELRALPVRPDKRKAGNKTAGND